MRQEYVKMFWTQFGSTVELEHDMLQQNHGDVVPAPLEAP